MLDPSIPLQVKPYEAPDVLQQYGRMLSLKNMIQGNKMNQMEMERAERERKKQEEKEELSKRKLKVYNQALKKKVDGEYKSDQEVADHLVREGFPDLAQVYSKAQLDFAASVATKKKSELELELKQAETEAEMFGVVVNSKPGSRPMRYKEQRAKAARMKLDVSQIPEEYNEELYEGLKWRYLQTTAGAKQLERLLKPDAFEDDFLPMYMQRHGKAEATPQVRSEARKAFEARTAAAKRAPEKPEKLMAGRDIPLPPDVEAQRTRIAQASKTPEKPLDPNKLVSIDKWEQGQMTSVKNAFRRSKEALDRNAFIDADEKASTLKELQVEMDSRIEEIQQSAEEQRSRFGESSKQKSVISASPAKGDRQFSDEFQAWYVFDGSKWVKEKK